MTFADLEDRANEAVMRRLSNARAQVVGQVTDFPVIFDNDAVVDSNGVTSTQPFAQALVTDAQGLTTNTSQLVIKRRPADAGVTYTLRDQRPHGSGLVGLILGRR